MRTARRCRGYWPPNDKTKEPRTRHGHRGGRAECIELLEHGAGIRGVFRQRSTKSPRGSDGLRAGRYASLRKRVEIPDGPLGRIAEKFTHRSWGCMSASGY